MGSRKRRPALLSEIKGKPAIAGTFDLIGDIHGMRGTLVALLQRLGHLCGGRPQAHPEGRKLIFLGDLLDRGPDPLGCLELVAKLVETLDARMVLGNHELNALHYMAEPPLRAHSQENRFQFSTTLAQIEEQPPRWQQAKAFLFGCPTHLKLDGGSLRVVHACFDQEALARLPLYIDSLELLARTAPGGDLKDPTDLCLKGPEEAVPRYQDKEGVWRTKRRIPWWESYPKQAPLVVFGHYGFPFETKSRHSMPPRPVLLGPGENAACVDFDSGRGGPLVALRYPELSFLQKPCQE